MLFSYPLSPWKPGRIQSNLKSECPTGWDSSQNIYKGGEKCLLHFRKHFSLLALHQRVLWDWKQWGGVSFLYIIYSGSHLLNASVRGKGLLSFGQRQVALHLKHLVTLFSPWLASKSNLPRKLLTVSDGESKQTLKVFVKLFNPKDSNWRICKGVQNEWLKYFSHKEGMFCSCTVKCFRTLGPAEMEGILFGKSLPRNTQQPDRPSSKERQWQMLQRMTVN